MGRSIVEWSVRALMMVAGTGLVLSGLRVRRASAQHSAWAATMIAMLLLPVWSLWGPSVTAPVLYEELPPPVTELLAPPPLQASPRAAVALLTEAGQGTGSVDWEQVLSRIYLAGLAAMLARLIAGTLQAHSLIRHAREAEGFLVSDLCAAPVTVGWLHPVLVLPDAWQEWPAARLNAVLVHEREHARRRDPLVQWLALLNRCVFWFHPAAWWLERRLAALAEEACDAAVLAGGMAVEEYASYLIELARAVHETGARIRPAGAVAFSDGRLRARVRRILDVSPATALSSTRAMALASLCALMLATFLACNVGPSKRARAIAEVRPQRQHSNEWLRQEASELTPDGVSALKAAVQAHPDDPDNMVELVLYYQSQNDLKSLDALGLWYIEKHPDARVGWWSRPEWDTVRDREGYARASQLWNEQLRKSWDSPFVYMNAAEYFSGTDNERAEQILRDGQRRFPATGRWTGLHWDRRWSGLHWEVFLARHYAWALMGSEGQLPNGQALFPLGPGGTSTDGPYARKVRELLLASKDTELLTRIVEQLQLSRPNREFCRSLIKCALSIDPENIWAHVERYELQSVDVLQRSQGGGDLSDSDRMVLLQAGLRPRLLPDGPGENVARELLVLAARNRNDPNYGTAILLADTVLGRAALKGGDKAEASRLLLAASEAPSTEFLRYHQLDMSLAQGLLDAGERESVATFLERCAKFNAANMPLAGWASQIRKGNKPVLQPVYGPTSWRRG